MPTLTIVIGSTRPGRVGLPVGTWVAHAARQHGAFDVEVADLAEIGLPLLDETKHPRLRQYEHDHTKAWSERIERADAFVFVTPEYNFAMPGALKNAIDFLHEEWKYRPVVMCSYGGVSAGLRASAQLKQVLQALSAPVVATSLNIPFVKQFLDDDGAFVPNDVLVDAADAAFTELARWEQALRPMRRGDA